MFENDLVLQRMEYLSLFEEPSKIITIRIEFLFHFVNQESYTVVCSDYSIENVYMPNRKLTYDIVTKKSNKYSAGNKGYSPELYIHVLDTL